MSKITYDDKVTLNETSVAAINKCQASDFNEIKTVVNANDDLVGDLSTLTTTAKDSIVNAINENVTKINTLQSVSTYHVGTTGNLASTDMWWRVLQLPNQYCGLVCLTTPGVEGVMTNAMFYISNSYGNAFIQKISSVPYSKSTFQNARIVYATDRQCYLELQTNGIVNQVQLVMNLFGSLAQGSFTILNAVGSVPSGYSTSVIAL